MSRASRADDAPIESEENWKCWGEHRHLFRKMGKAGSGTFGKVFKARVCNDDAPTINTVVALKYLLHVHVEGNGCKMSPLPRVRQEVKILRCIGAHPNLLSFVDVYSDTGDLAKTVIVTELRLMDLNTYIDHERYVADLSLIHI